MKGIFRQRRDMDAEEEGALQDRLKNKICDPLKKKAEDAVKGR